MNVGSEIKNEKSGKTAGKLVNARGEYGIAMLRLENVDKSGMFLVEAVSEVRMNVSVEIPKFWRLDDANIKALNDLWSK